MGASLRPSQVPGLSGAPPTEKGPAGLGSGGRSWRKNWREYFRDAWMTRVRGFGRGMLEVVNGGMLEVVSGARLICRELTCAVSKES